MPGSGSARPWSGRFTSLIPQPRHVLGQTLRGDAVQPANVYRLHLARHHQPVHQGSADPESLSGFLDPQQQPRLLRCNVHDHLRFGDRHRLSAHRRDAQPFAIDLAEVSGTAPGPALIDTSSLTEASNLIRQLTGISELDYETAKAAKRNGQPHHAVTVDDLATIDQHAQDAAERGADYISMRRLSELIGATTLDAYGDLGNLIATERPARYAPSIYRVPSDS